LTRYDQDHHRIRKRREKSTIILVSIVLIFLLCHMFRFSLKAYEVTHPSHTTAKHHSYCLMQGKFHIPVALYGLMSANNVLIVFNSSVNFIIYCLVEETFRSKLVSILKSWCMGFCRMIACCFCCKLCKVQSFRRVPTCTVPATAEVAAEHFPADFPPQSAAAQNPDLEAAATAPT